MAISPYLKRIRENVGHDLVLMPSVAVAILGNGSPGAPEDRSERFPPFGQSLEYPIGGAFAPHRRLLRPRCDPPFVRYPLIRVRRFRFRRCPSVPTARRI
jgi:hypothetical protein